MDINNFLTIFNSSLLANFLLKVFFLILSFFYVFYAFVIYKQVQVMNKVLNDRFKYLVSFISLAQVATALILFIFVIFLI